jgi:hypothetical protein
MSRHTFPQVYQREIRIEHIFGPEDARVQAGKIS